MARNLDAQWGTDVQVSLPEPLAPERKVYRVIGGGWVFTDGGLHHDITQAERDELYAPAFSPITIDRS